MIQTVWLVLVVQQGQSAEIEVSTADGEYKVETFKELDGLCVLIETSRD